MIIVMCGVLLSSCLGDSDSSTETNSEFACITTLNGVKYAATRYGYVHHSDINTLQDGDCVLAAFKYKTNNDTQVGHVAEYFTITDKFSNASQLRPMVTEVDTIALTRSDSAFTELGIPYYYNPDDYLQGRWLMAYKCKVRDKETLPSIEVYYDSNKQFDLNGKPLDKSEKIIDIRMKRYNNGTGDMDKSETAFDVIDFRMIKQLFETDKDENKVVYLRFRYHKLDSNGKYADRISLTNKDQTVFFRYLEED